MCVSVCADMEMPYYYHVPNAGGYVCAHSIVSVLSARLKIEMRERERAQHTHKVYSRGVGRRRLIGEAMRHPPCDFPTTPGRRSPFESLHAGVAGGGSLLLLFVGIDF